MDNKNIQLVGAPCGYHGPYTFYKAFKYTKKGIVGILSLSEFFFVKLWSDSDLVCIGELQLLWVDKNSDQILASLRLYFLPENTPEGRLDHGEDEVLAISEKVVLRVEDLLMWITQEAEWNWGLPSIWSQSVPSPPPLPIKNEDSDPSSENSDPLALNDFKDPLNDYKDPLADTKPFICTRRTAPALTDSLLDFSDIEKERSIIGIESMNKGVRVMVLSYPRYCRYRALMKRLESVEDKWLKNSIVAALGGFTSPFRNTRVLFCKDTFDYPDLEGHELLCNHLAPKLKGRPRGKRKKRSISPGGSESNESESSVSTVTASVKTRLTTGGRNGLRCNSTSSPRRSTRSTQSSEEKEFFAKLNVYMKTHRTTIGRIPSLGLKEVDLFQFYTKVQEFGGYDKVTGGRLWKIVYDELGGHQCSTSAATVTRKHYERLLLAFERSQRGEEHKPLPISERRRLKSKNSNSDTDNSEGGLSDRGTPTKSESPETVLSTPIDASKLFTIPDKIKPDGKMSSLRSVRVKPDRMRDVSKQDKSPTTSNCSTPVSLSVPNSPGSQSNTSPVGITPVPPAKSPNEQLPPPTVPISIPSNATLKDPSSIVADKALTEDASTPPQSIIEEKEHVYDKDRASTDQSSKKNETNADEDDDELVEIPYKPKTPEIIELEDDSQSSLSPTVPEMKKRKLDILKEGGLEVTPISSPLEIIPLNSEPRPSVIHHFNVPPEPTRGVSITVSTDAGRMLPPAPGHRPPSRILPTPDLSVQHRRTSAPSQKSPNVSSTTLYNNGQAPPRVIQSRSIYSHSEKTVYGNPKDTLMAPPPSSQISRQMIPAITKPPGGEILDLTVKSPQKPVVEIMRVPSVPLSSASRGYSREQPPPKPATKNPTGLPMIDGRIVGSNLEITLVGAPKHAPKMNVPPQKLPIPPTSNHNRYVHKRTSSGKFLPQKPISIRSENGKLSNHHNIPTSAMPHGHHRNGSTSSSANLIIPTPPQTNSRSSANKMEDHSRLKHGPSQPNSPSPFLPPASPLYSPYLPQLPNSNKHPYMPMIDPSLYYSALTQGLYPHNPLQLAAAPPLFTQSPTAEQLQLYKELINQNRMRFPFPPYLQDNPGSLASIGQASNNNLKN